MASVNVTLCVAVGCDDGFRLVTSMVDNLKTPGPLPLLQKLGADASAAALKASSTAAVESLVTASDTWWNEFWNVSGIALDPSLSDIERFWCGQQYILGISASYDPGVPAPGLFGPFVTTDDNGWNGDYTLDYNYEATFYGVYGTGRHALANSYWAPMVDGMPAARRGAQARAKYYNISCPATALHYNAHISPFGMGDFDEDWETNTGMHMHWNGVFGALLFINNVEYTGNLTFARETAWPLLTGLLDWWSCYLTKTPAPGHPDGYVYVDTPDQSHEGQNTPNPQIGLAMIKRLADTVLSLAVTLGAPTPSAAADIASHLAPFNSAECVRTDPNTGTRASYELWQAQPLPRPAPGDMFALYPIWPTEALSGISDPGVARIAQPTSKAVGSFVGGRPVQLFPAAVRAGIGATPFSYTANDITAGLVQHLDRHMFQNMLVRTPGGGVENVGVTRAINEMVAVSPHGDFIAVCPVWNLSVPVAFANIWVKGGFSVSASCDGGVVHPPVNITVHPLSADSMTFVNPWAKRRPNNVVVRVRGSGAIVPSTPKTTPLGPAVAVNLTGLGSRSYVLEMYDGSVGAPASDGDVGAPGIGCTAYSANCSVCLRSIDGRGAPWGGSHCVFLSGPSEAGARCQPAKWWFPPYDSAKSYPGVHACKSCTTPASACAPLPPPPPAPPAPGPPSPPSPPSAWACTPTQ